MANQLDSSVFNLGQPVVAPNIIADVQKESYQRQVNEQARLSNEQTRLENEQKAQVLRDNAAIAKSALSIEGQKYQPVPDANGATPTTIPGTEGLSIKNGWYVNKDGTPVMASQGPAYRPDGSPNIYSTDYRDKVLAQAKANGASPTALLKFRESFDANADDKSKKGLELAKTQSEIQEKQADVQKKLNASFSDAAFDIVNSPNPEEAFQHDLLLNPAHAEIFMEENDPENPDQHEPFQNTLARLAELAKTSDKAKIKSELEERASVQNDRLVDNKREQQTADATENQVVQGQVQAVDADGNPILDSEGNPTYTNNFATVNRRTGVTNPLPLGAIPKGGSGNATQERFNKIMATGAQEAAKSLTNLANEPGNAGYFGKSKSGILDVTKNNLTNLVSSEDTQIYNKKTPGLAKALLLMQNGGRQVSDGAVKELSERLSIKPTDTYLSAKQSLAEYMQLLGAALDIQLASNTVTPEIKKVLKASYADAREAIPYNVADIDQYRKKGKDDESVETFLYKRDNVDKKDYSSVRIVNKSTNKVETLPLDDAATMVKSGKYKAASPTSAEKLKNYKPGGEKSTNQKTLTPDLILQYATKHNISKDEASKFLASHGYKL